MQLVLFRHGIAIDREHPDCPEDRRRALTERGRRRTRAAARGLAALGVAPDLVLASPYVRTLETAAIAAEELGAEGGVEPSDTLLPGARPAELLDLLRRRAPACAVCVGHAPHMDLCLSAALFGDERERTRIKKAGAASVRLGPAVAGPYLEWLATPRALRRLGRTGTPA